MECKFFFDVMSPYTYFAFQVLKGYRLIWGLNVEFIPFFLGGAMNETGNAPPATVPARAVFLSHDLKRNAKWFNVAAFKNMPDNFFTDVYKLSIGVNRLLSIVCADSAVSVEAKWRIVDAAFHIIWESERYRAGSLFVVKPFAEIVNDLITLSGDKAVIQSAAAAVESMGKERLKANTTIVVESGGFGSPIFQFPNSVDTNIFFGSDRFEQIAHVLGKPWFGPSPGTPSRSKL